MFVEYLKEIFGQNNIKVESHDDVILPLYLKQYGYTVISLYLQKYVFVSAKNKVDLKSYKVQKEKIEKFFNCAAVLVSEKIVAAQRRNLIANGIMFVEIGKQIFMPMSGIVLNDSKERPEVKTEKFTPQIQLCALFFLYNRNGLHTVKQIVEHTHLNEMAISRGMKILKDLGLIAEENEGRTKYYRLCENEACYLEKIERYCISPVYKSIWINRNKKPDNIIKAGFSALSYNSMILDNEYQTYAISKEDYRKIVEAVELTYDDIINESEFIKLEVWKYNPLLFAEKDVVDKFSLYMSMRETQDERTEAILKEIKESILNG